jgi:phosphopantothenoylcysteine decarboxylase/phosphopantothenate--cysteine ligase
VVTAGPTREHLDPVRFLSNPSTGKMGFAVAEAAVLRGCECVLVAGPVALKTPAGVKRIDVVSAREMLAAVKAAVSEKGGTVLVATAAVADWRPAKCATRKLKKRHMSSVINLVRNPDILKTVKGVRKVGFAAETGAPVKEAARKCREKKLEFVVANDVLQKGAGFGCDTNKVTFVYPDGSVKDIPLMSKRSVARRIVDEVLRA